MRRTFADVLKSGGVNIKIEYKRLHNAFYKGGLHSQCAREFIDFPFRDTCVSLKDFDEYYGFHFEPNPKDFDLDYLINFCEYSYNLVMFIPDAACSFNDSGINNKYRYLRQISSVLEKVTYEIYKNDEGISIIVPQNTVANNVSEMISPNFSYKVIEYNHHSMKGDLERKQATLKLLADQLEARKDELNSINSSLKSGLFFLFNNINIRHNNVDPKSNSYKKAVADMTDDELEEWYDRTYDMCLYAFMTLDQSDHNAIVKALKAKIDNSKAE